MRIENLSVSFDGRAVIKNLNADLPEKGIIHITGASGSGKTTLLNAIAGLIPYEGFIEEKKVSCIFQDDRLFEHMTALENAQIAQTNENGAKKLLGILQMSDSLELYPDELSGGMKKRVNIARALAADYEILLADEPLSGLDSQNGEIVMNCFRNIAETKPVFLVSHEKIRDADYDINLELSGETY